MDVRILNLLAVAAGLSFGHAANPASRTDLSCVASLYLPTHGILASMAGESSTVYADVHIDGRPEGAEVRLNGGDRALQGEVQVALELSKFASRCKGRVLSFVFSFTLQDPPTDSILPPEVKFVPPNRFELTFRRRKPSHD